MFDNETNFSALASGIHFPQFVHSASLGGKQGMHRMNNPEDYESETFKSPLAIKTSMIKVGGANNDANNRVCFTEQKTFTTPFKNSTIERTNGNTLSVNNGFFNTERKLAAPQNGKQLNDLKYNELCHRENFQSENRDLIKKVSGNVANHAEQNATKTKQSKVKQSIGGSNIEEIEYQPKSFQGDRFIPSRMSDDQYEQQFQHEELLMLQRSAIYQNSANGNSDSSQPSNTNNNNSQVGSDGQPIPQSATQGSQQINGQQNQGDMHMNMYSNLLQTQTLGDSYISYDTGYQNLSYFGSGSQSSYGMPNSSSDFTSFQQNSPVGIFSTQSSTAVTGSGLNGSSSLNQTISSMMAASKKNNIFKYKNREKYQQENMAPYQVNPLLNIDASDEQTSPSVKNTRKIPKMPFKVLDAPQLQDDFYLNLVDWSSTNVLAVGLGRAVYIWSACTSRVTKLCEVPHDDSITSVSWSQRGTHLAVGTNSGDTQIWDTTHLKQVRTLTGHLSRVGCVAWSNSIVSTGSRDRNILQRDLRAHNQSVMKLVGHKQEVCGLKWSFDDMQLASGGNDNKLMVWSLQGGESPLVKFSDHTAAVKAIGWSPHQNGLLASGGGTADRCIRFWNTHTLQPINYIDTGSQVCNLMFSKNNNEIVSTHGYSLNQIIIWKYPSMQKVATLTGHTYRVLYLSMSPCGQNIVTGAGDETLRFWSAFPSTIKQKSAVDSFGGAASMSQLYPSSMDIR